MPVLDLDDDLAILLRTIFIEREIHKLTTDQCRGRVEPFEQCEYHE